MAKKRVYELAKDLDVQSKDILTYLNGQGFEVKSASGGLEDDAVALVEKHFGKAQAPKAEAPKAEAPKTAVEKTEAPRQEAPRKEIPGSAKRPAGPGDEKKPQQKPKKKNITAVFNSQYSSSNKQQRPRREGERPQRRNDGSRPQRQGGENRNPSAQTGKRVSIRPENERSVRPSHRIAEEQEEKARQEQLRREKEQNQNRQSRPNYDNQENRDNHENRDRHENFENRDRQDNRDRRDNRDNRDYASRENRENRPNRDNRDNHGNRDNRDYNSRENRGQQHDGNRGQQHDSNRGQHDGNRQPRENTRTGRDGNRSNYNNKRENAATASDMPTENRGKDNRRNNNRKNNNKREYDQPKKQERYVNLEKNGGKKRGKPAGPKAPERDMNEVLSITLPEHIMIKDLAEKMMIQPSNLIKTLFLKGIMVTVNQEVDFDQAEEIALEFNCICEPEEKVDVIGELLKEEEEDTNDMVPRPPVVCVMGHVDHGKTSLLDAIRDTKVTAREAGGITQHIGAYMVEIGGRKITFLDTPGHEAFTAMRMRGANSTDIAILVVAADDGVMPQTVEAINHAKAAGIEIIVAINKIDKPNANVERVKQELSEYGLIPEDWGGSTIFVPVSAHTKEGIDELLEMILLTADVLELQANPKRTARGLVIEARLDKGRGTVATVLVQKGTLHVGDPISAGSTFGKVRAMVDEDGQHVKEATPSTPVEILGLSDVPNAGEIFVAHETEKDARAFADTFVAEGKSRLIEDTKTRMSLDDLFSQIQSGNVKELDIIVKADVQGSVEAVTQSLVKLSNEEVVVKVIHGGVGAINESDVTLASASNAIIIGFNVRPDAQAKAVADHEGVDVRLYKVIYNIIEDVEAAMKGMLDPIYEEKIIGHAQVRQIFKASDVGNIAGSYVLDGTIERGCKVRISRAEEQIFEGDLASLKRFKDDVKEVKTGFECGLVIEGFSDVEVDDIIEAYVMVEVPR